MDNRPDMAEVHDWHAAEEARQRARADMLAHQELTRAGDRLLRALAPLFWAALGAIVVVVVLTVVEVVG